MANPLPASGAPRALLLAQLSNAIGDGAFHVSSALSFTRIVGLSTARIGIGLTLARAVGSLVGVPLGHLADRHGPRTTGLPEAVRAVRGSGVVMLASCAVFALTAAGPGTWTTVAVLVLGAALQVAAEMRHSAGARQIGLALAPADRIGQYQGFYGTGVPLARTLGPLLVTTFLVTWGVPGWFVFGGIFLLAAAATAPAVRRAERSRPPAGRPAERATAPPASASGGELAGSR
ncbi:hypothetical protein EAO71_19175 [Streptomyces sp. ms191]|uniref:MFS transporter n=1 Tax=Streptomyces sp. ms191 TaxID=1827978 RepID=UPI0011CDF0F0|nr:MFS transporter [Streptomyces sp. ms191]TXS30559.1 hypothetical protein EAO71_19175 [Streptomyces sp. ms191]